MKSEDNNLSYIQSSFEKWMKENKQEQLSSSSIQKYKNAIKTISELLDMNIDEITSKKEFQIFNKKALENAAFQQKNRKGNNMYSAALKYFGEFIKTNILDTDLLYPDVITDDELFEGGKKTVTVNAYERNSTARNLCIKHHGDACAVCGFRFADVWGDDFKGKIHVHHKKPLSEITKSYKVSPKEDLIPVCPNCHLVIHSKQNGTYSIEEVKKRLQK